MSDPSPDPKPKSTSRPVGGTESSWCKAVPGGTGITVVVVLFSKPPEILQNALDELQKRHPVLRSKLRFNTSTATFSFVTPPNPHVKIQSFDLQSTAGILRMDQNVGISPHRLVLEYELNNNTWREPDRWLDCEAGMFYASMYALSDETWAVAMRLHTSACDRTSAVALLSELLEEAVGGGGETRKCRAEVEGCSAIESLIPAGKANKPFWARGIDVLGYSLNSFRLANLKFLDTQSPRCSQVARLRMSKEETQKLVNGCKSKGIKLSAALAAAGLIAARSSKDLPVNHSEKYSVVTLMDCRSLLDPALSNNHLGFYHSAILNTHDVTGTETLWGLAKRCYDSFSNAKNWNKHFTDIGDVNFLMCKAIENPYLTPSSSLRTSFMSVFEDPVIDDSDGSRAGIGIEDYIGCSSIHGIGPSIAVFDAIRNGTLDCACVYPSPLHSRDQMQDLISTMKNLLVENSCCENN